MSTETSKQDLKAYEKDPRMACRYGVKCYQKNPVHHKKFKHPPNVQKEETVDGETIVKKGTKRRIQDRQDQEDDELSETDESHCKHRKDDEPSHVVDARCISPSPSESTGDEDFGDSTPKDDGIKVRKDELDDKSTINSNGSEKPSDGAGKVANVTLPSSSVDKKSTLDFSPKPLNDINKAKEIILELFLFDMPEDFYKFFDFCTSISQKDPSSALKLVDLKLVGPFDVLNGIIREIPEKDEDKEKFLRHWRYFYDPPEFQTILKGNDREGLHYGYWRDECDKEPVFVAKNSAKTSCKVISVASNIFGAVKYHIDERLKVANLFDKSRIAALLKMLTSYANNYAINIEKCSTQMRERDRKVVTKTFHGAGIVVPYDKKTQLGYRDLIATDSQLQKVLDKIAKAEYEEVKLKYMSELGEVVRLAAIAADECDFGTPLELAHDLLSSGIDATQKTMLHMFSMSYNLLQRPQFLKIVAAHMKDRRKSYDLSVL